MLGVAYDPEHWPESRGATDARLMREAGLELVRLAEFTDAPATARLAGEGYRDAATDAPQESAVEVPARGVVVSHRPLG